MTKKLWETIKDVRSDGRLSQSELGRVLQDYEQAVLECREDAAASCREERRAAEFLFMSSFERMLKSYRIDWKDGADRLSRLMTIVNGTRQSQGLKPFHMAPAIGEFYALPETEKTTRMVRISIRDELEIEFSSRDTSETVIPVNTLETIEPKTMKRFDMLSEPAYRELPELGRKALKNSKIYQSVIDSGAEDPDGNLEKTLQYYHDVFVMLEKIPDEMRTRMAADEKWKEYLNSLDPKLPEILSKWLPIAIAIESLSKEERTAVRRSYRWKECLSKPLDEWSRDSLGEDIAYYSEVFSKLSQLPEDEQNEIRSSLLWANVMQYDSHDDGYRQRLLLALVPKKEKERLAELAKNGLWPLKYSAVPDATKTGKEQGVMKIQPPRVSPEKSDKGIYRQPNVYDSKTNGLSIYFPTNSSTLDRWDESDLRSYLESIDKVLKTTGTIMLEGYADARGWAELNQKLSERRAETLRRFLERYGQEKHMGFKVRMVSFWNTKASGDRDIKNPEEALALDRKTIITPHVDGFLRSAIEQSQDTTVYLIDGSGSMDMTLSDGKTNKIETVRHLPFNPKAQFYRFSDTGNTGEVLDLQKAPVNELAVGLTPLLHALKKVIEMNSHGVVTIISDGVWSDDEDTAVTIDTIRDLAKQNDVRLNVIGIGIPQFLRETFQQLARDTGGFYVIEHE